MTIWWRGKRDPMSKSASNPDHCPFCAMPPERVLEARGYAFTVLDTYPVSPGHSLVIPRRHVADLFELRAAEIGDIVRLIRSSRQRIERDLRPTGYNIGAQRRARRWPDDHARPCSRHPSLSRRLRRPNGGSARSNPSQGKVSMIRYRRRHWACLQPRLFPSHEVAQGLTYDLHESRAMAREAPKTPGRRRTGRPRAAQAPTSARDHRPCRAGAATQEDADAHPGTRVRILHLLADRRRSPNPGPRRTIPLLPPPQRRVLDANGRRREACSRVACWPDLPNSIPSSRRAYTTRTFEPKLVGF